MNYTKYYTPIEISDFLIKQLNIEKPKKAIDICCGSCNLLHAVKKRWNNVKLTGVDIVLSKSDDVNITVSDGREYALNCKNKYPLVVANPPFDKVERICQYPELYAHQSPNLFSMRLEVEMLYANLYLLQKDGTLIIIMPISFVNAQRYKKHREFLANNYFIESLYKLPLDTFGSSKIKTYALIIKNKKVRRNKTALFEVNYNKNGDYCATKINDFIISDGEWFKDNYENNIIDLKRGNISSNQFCENGLAVLHTARKADNWIPSVRYIKNTISKPIYAEYGDIIVSRVGQSAGCFCVYTGKKILISDCLYRIKDPSGNIANTLINKKYDMPIRGVATPYITMSDFVNWYSMNT